MSRSAPQFGGVAVTHSIPFIAFEIIGTDDVVRHDDTNFALKLGTFIQSAGIPSEGSLVDYQALIVGHSRLIFLGRLAITFFTAADRNKMFEQAGDMTGAIPDASASG